MRPRHSSRRLAAGILTVALAALACGFTSPTASAAQRGPAAPGPELEALKKQLDRLAAQGKAGKAQYWYVDRAAGRVHIAVYGTARDATTTAFLATGRPELTATTAVAKPVRPFVGVSTKGRQEATAADNQTPVYGGQKITAGRAYCTTGFNVLINGQPRTLTAGHCRKVAVSWDLNGVRLGDITAYTYPGRDVAEITTVAGWDPVGAVRKSDGSLQAITTLGRPSLNQRLCKTGATSADTCGTVTALDVTVRYPDGPVYGLAATTVYAAEGDSGGSVYDTSTAVGLISGGPQGGGDAFVFPPF
jgi:streptogrisin D